MAKFDWTEEEIASRIGASTTALLFGKFNAPLGPPHIARWRELGITKMEVGYPDPSDPKQTRAIAAEARNQGVEIVSVHGPSGKFSEEERRAAVQSAIIGGEAALEMGATCLPLRYD